MITKFQSQQLVANSIESKHVDRLNSIEKSIKEATEKGKYYTQVSLTDELYNYMLYKGYKVYKSCAGGNDYFIDWSI